MTIRYAVVVSLQALLFLLVSTALSDDAFDKLIKSGKFAEAISYADEKMPVTERTADQWAKLGIANEEQKLTEKALACFMVAIRNDGSNYEAHLGAARVYNNMKDHENALEMAKKAMKIKETGEASWEYARACIALKKTSDAKEALEKVVETDKSNIVANRALGMIYYESKSYDKALPLLKKSNDEKNEGEIAYTIAGIYKIQKNFDSATVYMREAVRDKNFSKPEVAVELANIYFDAKKYKDALSAYDKADQTKLSADDLYRMGISAEKSGLDKNEVVKIYQKAVEKFGKSTSKEALNARSNVARWNLEKKAYKQALGLFLEIRKADNQGKVISDATFLTAEAYEGLGEYSKAIPLLENVISKEKENVEAYVRLADLYTKAKMEDKARIINEKLLSLQPDNPKVYFTLGEYYLKTKKYDDAFKNFQKSFALKADANAAQGMMKAAWEQKKFDLALDAAETALHHDKNLTEPQVVLAKIHIQNGKYSNAQSILEDLVKKEEENKDWWQQLALCYEKTKNEKKMAQADKKIMSLDKKDTVSRLRYANYSMNSGELKEAKEVYSELALLMPKNPDVFSNLYRVCLKTNDNKGAVENLRQLVKLKPEYGIGFRDLGNLLYEMKDSDGALGAYRAAIKADPSVKGFYKKYAQLLKEKKAQEQEILTVLTAAVKANEADEEIYNTLGEIYLNKKDYNKSIENYQKALQINPKNLENLKALGLSQVRAGKKTDAVITYEQLITMDTSCINELKILGDLYMEMGKKEQAIASYKKYLVKKPDDSKISLQVGNYELEKKNYKDAVKYMEKVSGNDAQTADFLSNYASASIQVNDFAKANKLLEQLSKVSPNDPAPLKMLYEIAEKQKDKKGAADYLKKYTALKPDDIEMQKKLGDLLFDLKDKKGALDAYNSVLKQNPKAKGFYKNYVVLIKESGTDQEKIQSYSGAIAAGEADVAVIIELGDIYSKQGNHKKALEMYDKAGKLDPKDVLLLAKLAQSQAESGNTDAAILTYEQTLAMNPKADKEYKILGDLYKKKNKTASAIKNYKKYLESKSDNGIAREIGEYEFKAKNYSEAVKYFGMVTGKDADNIDYLKMYGDACLKAKDQNKAYQIYKQLAVKAPQDPDVFKTLYQISEKTGPENDKISYLKSYTKLKPSDANAQKKLGDILYAKKDNAGALEAYKAVLKADSSAKGFYKNFTDLMIKSGGSDNEMIIVLSKAIQAGEADLSVYKHLGDIYRKVGNHQKASAMYEKASQLDPKSVALLTSLAESQVAVGKINDAILTYEQAIAMNPQAGAEYKLLGDLYKKQNKNDQAVKNYKKFLEKGSDDKLSMEVGKAAFKAKNYQEAVKYLGMIKGADSQQPSYLKMYGEACFLAKDQAKAYEIFKQLATVTPADAEVFKKLYEIAEGLGKKDDLLTYLKSYTRLRPKDVGAQKKLGDILYERKDANGAINAYGAVLAADPSAKGFYNKYAKLVINSGKDTEIVKVLTGAIKAGEADGQMYAKLGEIYQKQQKYTDAVAMYEKAIQFNPKDVSLLNRLSECQIKGGKPQAAILTLEQAVAMNPQANKEYKMLGDLYMQQKKSSSALTAYKKYLEKSKDNEIAKIVGKSAYESKKYDEAVKYFGMVTGADASDPKHLMMYGQASYNAKDEFKAYQIFKSLAKVTPKDPEVFRLLAEIAAKAGTKEEVLQYSKAYASLAPSDAKAQKTLGDMLYVQKDHSGSLNAYRTALKADPSLKGLYKNYVSLVLKSGADAEKERALNGAISAGEADAKMYQALGEIYKKQTKVDNAVKMYEKAVQLDPKNTELLSALADCQVSKGMTDAAILTYEQVIAMDPKASKEYKVLGDLYMKQKKDQSAIRSYKKYLEKNASDGAVAKIVGEYELNQKNYKDAVRYFGMVKGDDAKKADLLSLYGEASFLAQDYPRALIIYKDLAKLTPKDADVFKRMYEITMKTGASNDAQEYLKQYTQLKPNDADAQKMLGDALLAKKDENGALNAYRAALKFNPKIKGIHKNYVTLVLKLGKPAEKFAALNGAINANEADASMYKTLGEIYESSKKYNDAIRMFEKASQLDPKNGEYLSALADCQMKAGKVNEAIVTYEQALVLNPKAVEEYKQLGDLYMKQKKVDDAMNAYKKYLDKKSSDNETAKIVAKHAFDNKKYQDAYKYYKMVKDDSSPQYLVEFGLSSIEVKDYQSAINVLTKVRDIKGNVPNRDKAYKGLAEAYEKNGDKKKAAEILTDYISLPGVNDPEAAYSLALVNESLNPKQAVEIYKKNTVSYPKDYRNFLKLGIYYSNQSGAANDAIKYLEKCAALSDTIPRVWLELGSLYGKLKRDKDMLNAYRKFITVDPENADATGKIGQVLLNKKMVDDAMVFLEMANSLKENDPKLMALLARGYLMTNRRNEGARLLERVVQITKGNIDDDLRMALIDVYMETGKYKDAVNELEILVSRSQDTNVWIKYAMALYNTGSYKDALKAVEKVKNSDPQNIDVQMMLGRIMVAMKDYDDAIETYKGILYIDQNYAPALIERANVYLIQRKYQWAKTFFDRAIKADPNSGLAYLGLARLAKEEKDYANYSSFLEKAKKLEPNNKEIINELKSMRR